MDAFLGLLIALLILYAAYEIFMDSVNPLLGRNVDQKTIKKIQTICKNAADFTVQPHHFHIHEYGAHKELTFHIRVAQSIHLEKIHQYRLKVKQEIDHKLGLEATIQIDSTDGQDT